MKGFYVSASGAIDTEPSWPFYLSGTVGLLGCRQKHDVTFRHLQTIQYFHKPEEGVF